MLLKSYQGFQVSQTQILDDPLLTVGEVLGLGDNNVLSLDILVDEVVGLAHSLGSSLQVKDTTFQCHGRTSKKHQTI